MQAVPYEIDIEISDGVPQELEIDGIPIEYDDERHALALALTLPVEHTTARIDVYALDRLRARARDPQCRELPRSRAHSETSQIDVYAMGLLRARSQSEK